MGLGFEIYKKHRVGSASSLNRGVVPARRWANGAIAKPKREHQWCVYFLSAPGDGVKIGHTGNFERRLRALETGRSAQFYQVGMIHTSSKEAAKSLEKQIHRHLKAKGRHIRKEWFRLTEAEGRDISDAVKKIIENRLTKCT